VIREGRLGMIRWGCLWLRGGDGRLLWSEFIRSETWVH
jgi:hypothetical protein